MASKKVTTKVQEHSIRLGEKVFIRTVTYHYTGRVKSITASDLVLEDAAWIADSGRYHNALMEGTLSEVEPIPGWVIICRGAIVDISPWKHELPRKQI